MDLSILIAGKAGEGARGAGHVIAEIFIKLGYKVYIYEDYQSLIRGGHNFAIVRISDKTVETIQSDVDLLIALNQESIDKHIDELKEGCIIICDKNLESPEKENTIQVPAEKIVENLGGSKIMKNTALIAAFVKSTGIDFSVFKKILEEKFKKGIEKNLKIAKEVYDNIEVLKQIPEGAEEGLTLIEGNEAVALGALNAGMDTYIAYPMTPATSILHFLAKNKKKYGVKVIQPESEISVLNMALGASYAGRRVAVGTSGGGFALMIETLSLAVMTETSVLIIESQRMSPASGVPTYNGQGDLSFVLNAGHGDIVKFTAAPGNAEEAREISKKLLNLSVKYQTPSVLLIDKQISESSFSVIEKEVQKDIEKGKKYNGEGEYLRYKFEDDGVSPFTPVGSVESSVKVTSYEHDEKGYTTEDPEKVKKMQDKRLLKFEKMTDEVENMKDTVKIYGDPYSKKVAITWGSAAGPAKEAIEEAGIKLAQILMLQPFPKKRVAGEIEGAEEIIVIEQNATGQMSKLLRENGIFPDKEILRYDSRPMAPEEITNKL